MKGLVRTSVVVIVTAAIFGLTYGLSAPLIAMELAEAGYSESLIGVNGAMYAVAVLLAAPYLPRLSQRLGFARLSKSALVAAGGLFALFPLAPFLWIWFPLRAALGAASKTLFVVSETRLNQIANEANRGRLIAICVTVLSCGAALGPAILALVGREQSLAFAIGAAIALVACVILILGRPEATRPAGRDAGNPFQYLFLWGGVFVGIYTTTVAKLGDDYQDDELLGIYALLSIAWGAGALLGPLIGGIAMDIPPHGLPIFAAIACGGFALFAGTREDRGRHQ